MNSSHNSYGEEINHFVSASYFNENAGRKLGNASGILMRNLVNHGVIAVCHSIMRLTVLFIASKTAFHSVILYVTEGSRMTAVL